MPTPDPFHTTRQVAKALKDYGLSCHECTQEQAVAKVNNYVKAKKREAARGVAEADQKHGFFFILRKVPRHATSNDPWHASN